jgi:hypothetical protein
VNGFLDSLVDYLQSHLTMVIDYAEKYGINIPVSEDSVVNEPLENGDTHDDHDELSALLQSATSKLLDGMNVDGPAESLTDSLGLGKLIQESLQSQSVPVKDEGAETNGNGSGLLESGGLASLIASKLTDFDHFSNASNVTPGEGQHHGLPQVTNGKAPRLHLLDHYLTLSSLHAVSLPRAVQPPPILLLRSGPAATTSSSRWKQPSAQPDVPYVCSVRESPASGSRKVFLCSPPRGDPLDSQGVDTRRGEGSHGWPGHG